MAEYTLKVDEATGKVRYLMKQNGANVVGETSLESALWMLKQGKVRRSEAFEGFQVTSDGVYFFQSEDDAETDGDGSADSPVSAGVRRKAESHGKDDEGESARTVPTVSDESARTVPTDSEQMEG